ncbi:hypothetical protein [Kytococcus sp. Marseille-QA3725]
MSTTHKILWTLVVVAATAALGWSLASAGTAYLASLFVLAASFVVAVWLTGASRRLLGWLVAGVSVVAAFVWLLQRDPLDAWPFLALALGAAEIAGTTKEADPPRREEALGSRT